MVLAVGIILFVFSQLNIQFEAWGIKTKKIALLSDIQLKGKAKRVPLPGIIITDSIIVKDSVAVALREADPINIFDFGSDSVSALHHFFEALNLIRKKKSKVRIAYFGDSMIEGDLISQDLRTLMQDVFGGSGVGFVPVTSVVAGFRTSIQHSFKGWTTYNLINTKPANHLLGVSGYDFVPFPMDIKDTTNKSSESWVKYSGVNKKHLDKFYQIKLLYGKSEEDNYVIINGVRYKLSGTNTVNQLVVESKSACQYIDAQFQCKTSVDIFGFSMESDSGVIVDNFSFRGNSGMPIVKVSQSIYSGTNDCLNYDLIILEYSLNAVNSSVTDYSWYENGMTNVIKHMQASFPNASIMLISVGDKSYQKDGIFQTDPSVPILVEAQKRMAKNNKLAFWNLYDAMGGNGSMVKWVEGDTALANKDYTHFNFKGAHKVGKLLFNKLMSEYSDYNKKHK